MKRRQLSQSEHKELTPKAATIGVALSKKDDIVEIDGKVFLVNNKPAFFVYEARLLPTLKRLLSEPQAMDTIKKVTVDMGAVRFVVNGADIMRPGIVAIDEGFAAGDIVVVIDQNNKKPLSVCIALFSSSEMQEMKQGKALKNAHYVGDDVWKMV